MTEAISEIAFRKRVPELCILPGCSPRHSARAPNWQVKRQTRLDDEYRVLLNIKGKCLKPSDLFWQLVGYDRRDLLGRPMDAYLRDCDLRAQGPACGTEKIRVLRFRHAAPRWLRNCWCRIPSLPSATAPSKALHAIAKYSSFRPRRTAPVRSKMADSGTTSVLQRRRAGTGFMASGGER